MGSVQNQSAVPAPPGSGPCAAPNGNSSVCNQRVGLATATHPHGPWTRRVAPIVDAGKPGAWDDLFTTNPTPHVLQNGSVLLLYKARSRANWNKMSTGVAFAEHWSGPYERRGTGPVDVSGSCEDAGIYYSEAMAVFRIVLHCGCNYQALWSLDGVDWHRTATLQPWCHITYSDGTTETMSRRERPKWQVDKAGKLVGLLTGVFPTASHGKDSFTMAQSILP